MRPRAAADSVVGATAIVSSLATPSKGIASASVVAAILRYWGSNAYGGPRPWTSRLLRELRRAPLRPKVWKISRNGIGEPRGPLFEERLDAFARVGRGAAELDAATVGLVRAHRMIGPGHSPDHLPGKRHRDGRGVVGDLARQRARGRQQLVRRVQRA